MKKLYVVLFLMPFLLPAQALAMTAPIVGTIDRGVTAAGGTQFYSFEAGVTSALTGTAANAEQPVGAAGTVGDMEVKLSVAPGAGTSYAFTLMDDGVATSVTCTVANTNTTCNDHVDTKAVVAGATPDRLSWKVVPSGTTASGVVNIASSFIGTTAGEASFSGGTAAVSGNATTHMSAFGGASGTEANIANIMPTNGTIDNFQCNGNVAPGAAATTACTLFKNGTATAETCTLSGASQTVCNDLNAAHAVSYSAADTISVQVVSSNATTVTVTWGWRWKPTIDGEYPLFMSETTFSTGVGKFEAMYGAGDRSSVEATESFPAPVALTLKDLYFSVSTDPATTASWNIITKKNTVSGTVTATINHGTTVATPDTTHSDSYTTAQLADYLLTPTNTPAAPTWMHASIVSFIQPPVVVSGHTLSYFQNVKAYFTNGLFYFL